MHEQRPPAPVLATGIEASPHGRPPPRTPSSRTLDGGDLAHSVDLGGVDLSPARGLPLSDSGCCRRPRPRACTDRVPRRNRASAPARHAATCTTSREPGTDRHVVTITPFAARKRRRPVVWPDMSMRFSPPTASRRIAGCPPRRAAGCWRGRRECEIATGDDHRDSDRDPPAIAWWRALGRPATGRPRLRLAGSVSVSYALHQVGAALVGRSRFLRIFDLILLYARPTSVTLASCLTPRTS